MNPQMYMEAQHERSSYVELALNETEILAGWGFVPHEIASLLRLRQWCQTGGSDRANVVRHLEFLRLLVQSANLEV